MPLKGDIGIGMETQSVTDLDLLSVDCIYDPSWRLRYQGVLKEV